MRKWLWSALWDGIARNLDGGGAAGGGAASGAGAAGGGAAGAGAAGGGAAGGGAGDAAGGGGQSPPDNLAAAARGAAAPDKAAPASDAAKGYAPEGLPEELRGASDKDTIDKLFGKLNGMPKAPDKADAYEFKPSKDIAGLIDPKSDKVLPIFREVAKAHNLSNDAFNGVINDLYAGMMKAGLVKAPVDMASEFVKLGGQGDPATQKQNGMQRVLQLADQLEGMATRELITQDMAQALISGANTAAGVLALERLISRWQDTAGAPAAGGQPGTAGVSRGDVEKRFSDPRYQWGNKQFSQSYYEETNRLWEQVSGTRG